jgi:hypothetical protein
MPTYCFRHPEDGILERDFPMGEAPKFLRFEDGSIAPRDYSAENVSGIVKGTNNPVRPRRKTWPMSPCYASGVHASQAGELRKHLADRGCPTEVSSDGDPIYISAAHRKKALKIRGMHDKASFN